MAEKTVESDLKYERRVRVRILFGVFAGVLLAGTDLPHNLGIALVWLLIAWEVWKNNDEWHPIAILICLSFVALYVWKDLLPLF